METATALVSWLESTALAQYITQSTIAFPAIEIVHVIAIALVFGTIAIVDLRLLGLGSNNRAVTELCRDVLPWTWGAYGIAAALAGHLGNREVLHDEATELRIVHASVAGGAMDGAYSRLIPYVDGTSDRVQASLITLLHQIVENGLKEYDRGF